MIEMKVKVKGIVLTGDGVQVSVSSLAPRELSYADGSRDRYATVHGDFYWNFVGRDQLNAAGINPGTVCTLTLLPD